VLVPIFNALEEVRECVDSVLANTVGPYRLLLIDDHSTNPAMVPLLLGYADRHAHLETILNPENLGYTATINIGCRHAPGDVILLNSDTQVTAGWNQKLAATAYCRPRVATVTPVSNAAGAFSVPDQNVNRDLPAHVSVAEMGQIVERLSDKRRPETPTGNGFCMYITSRALREVGEFDEQSFPMGYGEENDFCMRAAAKGFIHLIDDATFVFHRRASSFGAKRDELLPEAKARIRQLHPDYQGRVREFLSDDRLGSLRGPLRTALADPTAAETALGDRPSLLFVLHVGEGGTPHTNADLVGSLANQYECFVLTCAVRSWSLYRQNGSLQLVDHVDFEEDWRGDRPLSADRLAWFRRTCSERGIELVHVRHVLGSGPELIDEAKDLGLPVVFSFHDFSTVCPTLHLVDEHGRFCGGRCTDGDGDCPVSERWFPSLPPLKHRYVHTWRERFGRSLAQCDVLVTTSRTARGIVLQNFPFLESRPFPIIEHGRDYGPYGPVGEPPGDPPVRVACFGALGANKAIGLVTEVMRLDAAGERRFEFHFLGRTARLFQPRRWGGIIHGEYERELLSPLLADIRPSFTVIPSTTAETRAARLRGRHRHAARARTARWRGLAAPPRGPAPLVRGNARGHDRGVAAEARRDRRDALPVGGRDGPGLPRHLPRPPREGGSA
jgi:GT2 family glycosyltransferase